MNIWIIIILLLSLVQITPEDFLIKNNSKASSTWSQSSESDFKNGTYENVTITTAGEVKLAEQYNFVEDEFINESKIGYRNNVMLDAIKGEARLMRNEILINQTYGGPKSDWCHFGEIQPTADGGYIFIGTTDSYGAGGWDVWLIKLNKTGHMEWNRTFGGSDSDYGYSVKPTSDDGYILAGKTESFSSGLTDGWLIKTDCNGTEEWNRTFGGVKYDGAHSVLEISGNEYLICGYTISYGANYEPDVWLIKTNGTGIEQWNKTYNQSYADVGYEIKPTSDGGYIILAETRVLNTQEDVWIIKLNGNYSLEWNRTFAWDKNEYGAAIEETIDGGFIIAGSTDSFTKFMDNTDVFLIKTNDTGIMTWKKTYTAGSHEWGHAVKQTSDGSFIVLGYTNNLGVGGFDVWLLKMDNMGIEQWNRTYGGVNNDEGYLLTLSPEGDYVLVSETQSFGQENIWFLMIKKETIRFNKSYGPSMENQGWWVEQTSDGGYIFIGHKEINSTGNWAAWLVKTDNYGNITWNKTFGGITINNPGKSVHQTNDSGYIFLSHTYTAKTNLDIWIIKTNSTGHEQWNKSIIGDKLDFGSSIRQTSDNGYIIIGQTMSNSAGGYDIWLVKTNSTGDMEWNKTFGGVGTDMGRDVWETDDGGFIIIGDTSTYSIGGYDVWLIKTNETGVEEWNRTFSGIDEESGASVQQTSDHGFIIAGHTRTYGPGNHDAWLIKTNKTGIEQWNRTYGMPGVGLNGIDFARSVDQTIDGGYFMVGQTYSFGAGGYDIWIIKTNETGLEQWNRTFGNNQNDEGRMGQQTLDGGYIIIGVIKPNNSTQSKVHLIKTDSKGYLVDLGTLISKNLLEGQNTSLIYNFTYNASIPDGTQIEVQFSQNCLNWYNIKGIINKTTSLQNGSGSFNLSNLNWAGASFYYKMRFSSENMSVPVLKYTNLTYSSYNKSGTLISEPLNTGYKHKLLSISWLAKLPEDTDLKFQVRTAITESGLESEQFIGPDSTSGSYYTLNGTTIAGHYYWNTWVQYIAYLSTFNTSVSPILYEITISYNLFPNEPTLVSPQNNSIINYTKPTFSWIFDDGDSSGQGGFEIEVASNKDFTNLFFRGGLNSDSSSYVLPVPILDGIWYWRIRTKDIEGEWGSFSNYRILTIDTEIRRPENVVVTPATWTGTDAFSASWKNPNDVSGIIGVYYKMNSLPISNTDGIHVTGIDINSINKVWGTKSVGENLLYLWLEDIAGNINYNNHSVAKLYYDSTTPGKPKDLTVKPNSWTKINSFDIYWTNPNDLSGIGGVFYKLGSKPKSNLDGKFILGDDINELNDIVLSVDGERAIYLWLKDNVGNLDYNNYASAKLYLDITPPSAPENIQITPENWTASNNFIIDWVNPQDSSGIKTGAYYYIGETPPISHTDGTWISEKPFSVSTESLEGEFNIYLWLEDNVGNVDFKNYDWGTLKIDRTAPAKPNVSVSPSNWTSINSFTINWTVPEDLAGVKDGIYYYLGEAAPEAQANGTWTTGKPVIISNAEESINHIYVWLEDLAGNTNYQNYGTAELFFDSTPPTIQHFPVYSGNIVRNISISATVFDDNAGVLKVELYIKSRTALKYTIYNMTLKDESSYISTIPGKNVTAEGLEYFIKAVDRSRPANVIFYGKNGTTSIQPTYTTDIDIEINTGPIVIDYSPRGKNVKVNSTISVTFNKPIDKSTTPDIISVSPPTTGSLKWEGNKLILIPVETLLYDTKYIVTISIEAIDTSGVNLAENYSWNFTTEKKGPGKEPDGDDMLDAGRLWMYAVNFIVLLILALVIVFIIEFINKKRKSKGKSDEKNQVKEQIDNKREVKREEPEKKLFKLFK